MISPPTDSLYKFLSITGLVILLWGATFPWQKSYEYRLEEANLLALVTNLGNKQEYLEERFDSLEKSKINIENNKTKNNEKSILKIEREQNEIQVEIIDIENKINTKVATMKVLKEALDTYQIIGWLSVGIGFLLTVLGFYYWYVKVQRHIDTGVIGDGQET